MSNKGKAFLDAAESLQRRAPAGITVNELCDELGVGPRAVREKLQTLIRGGRAKFAGHKSSKRIDGQNVKIPVYQIVGK